MKSTQATRDRDSNRDSAWKSSSASSLRSVWFLGLLAAACGAPADRAQTRDSTISLAYCCGERVLNPMMDTNARMLVFLPLARHDEKGELEGRLARRWEHSADYREWTFHLRTDVLWHDGTPVTGHDVAFTIDLWAHPEVNWYGAAGVESTAVPDDSTVVIRYGQSMDALQYQPWLVYYPRHLLEGLDPGEFYDWEFWLRPVGNGPYRVTRTVPATLMELKANERHYEGKPPIERVVLRFVDGAGLTELMGGGVDILTEVEPGQARQLAEDPRFRLYHSASTGMGLAVYWNHRSPPFADPQVRRALMPAVNREELRSVLGFPEDMPILDGPFSLRQLARGEISQPVAYDPVEAERLLIEAGWVDGDGDGVRERAGRALRFTALVSDQPARRQIGVSVQAMLRRVGVHMEVQSLEGSVVFRKVQAGEFEAAVLPTGIPADWLQHYFGAESLLGYRSPEVGTLVDRLAINAEPEILDRIFGELTDIFRRESPALFLFPSVQFVLATRRVQGLSSPWRAHPTPYMDALWLEDRRDD